MPLTDEQQVIIDEVRAGRHVSVVALPGSGKSRVAYELIRQCTEDAVIALVMYNRSLCDATTAHIAQMELGPGRTAKAMTFHGLASSLTGNACHNDRQITRALRQPVVENWPLADCTLAVIDESQDSRPDLVAVVHHMIRSVLRRRDDLRIVILGDPRQLLYDFYQYNRADARFLTLGHRLLQATNTRAWSQLRLTRSFRSTYAVADFLNAIVPGHGMVGKRTEPDPDGRPVTIDICNVRSTDPAAKTLGFVSRYCPADVLVLCSSLNRNSPARAIVRMLVQNGVPVHVQRSGTIRETQAATHSGCVQFKTFCAAKGLEAKLVIVLNDQSLCRAMRNDLYVGLSRSVEELIVFQDRLAISLEEIAAIRTGLRDPRSVRFVRNRDREFPAALPPPPGPIPGSVTNSKYYQAETMFRYTDPTSLLPVEALVQSTVVGHDDLDDVEEYQRLFVAGGIGVQCIIQQALRYAVDYWRRRRIPKYILDLRDATDPHVARLFARGMQVMDMVLPHVPDPWDFRNLCLRMQAFAMFATAKDARQGFDDKIRGLDDFGFAVHPCVASRLRRILDQMDKYIPDRATPFMRVTYRRVDPQTRISGRPLIRSSACVYVLANSLETDTDSVLQMGLYLAIHHLEYGYISNTLCGSLTQVHVPVSDHERLLAQITTIFGSGDSDVSDEEFVRRNRLVG